MECITNSAPSSKLSDVLLHFNPWQIASECQFQYTISTEGPAFLRWLEEQESHERPPFIIYLSCSHANVGSQIPSTDELFAVQFRNFNECVLEALRAMPSNYQVFFPVAICLYFSFDSPSLTEEDINDHPFVTQ
jgi:hypothetical protein